MYPDDKRGRAQIIHDTITGYACAMIAAGAIVFALASVFGVL